METQSFLYKQLAADIESQIRRGELRPGDKLPSLRILQDKLGMSLNTVYQAYMELEAMGLVEAQAKSGFFIKKNRLLNMAAPRFARKPDRPRKVRLSDITNTVVANSLNPDLVPLGASTLSPDLLPQKHLTRIMRGITPEMMAPLLQYTPSEGSLELRRKLTFRMLGLVPDIRERDVTITNGCSEAVALALLATTDRGDVVAVESPTHFGFLQLLRELGLLVMELPTDPLSGVVTEGLSQVLRDNKVRVCLLMPNFQNPMGALMTDSRKEELVAILHEANIPVIEDDIYAEMHFGKKRPRLLKHWDQKGLVITCSSFSKILAPGFRVGWVVANGDVADRIRRLKAGFSMAAPTLQQHVLTQFLAEGALDRYLRLLRASVYNQVLKTAMAVQHAFPEGSRLSVPEGGNMLWIELPSWADGTRLYQEALEKGISIVPGAAFSTTDHFGHYIRLSCTSPFSEPVEAAVNTLGELVRSQQL
ncbi:MAG: PLP-dependent aminotransferase family protein [Desulfobacterales bacterium]|nr:PLP-dependent aminotransferase family protein [Desulfobacterales bacterium]